jgi:hypothetical protein
MRTRTRVTAMRTASTPLNSAGDSDRSRSHCSAHCVNAHANRPKRTSYRRDSGLRRQSCSADR